VRQTRGSHLLAEVVLQLALALYPLVLAERVDLVHKHLEDDVRVDPVRRADSRLQPRQCLGVVVLRIDDPHERAAAAVRVLWLDRRRGGVNVPREVPDLKLDERRVVNVVLDQLVGGLEEERLVRRHLVEDHLLDRRLARPPRAHQ